jgi:hypothetical protein
MADSRREHTFARLRSGRWTRLADERQETDLLPTAPGRQASGGIGREVCNQKDCAAVGTRRVYRSPDCISNKTRKDAQFQRFNLDILHCAKLGNPIRATIINHLLDDD